MPLTSIESISNIDIIHTMNKPIRVHANDLDYYICKYNRISGCAYRLYKEFLIASFLPIWGFNHERFEIINIQEKHLEENLGIDKRYFKMPCFGSKVIENSNEFDKHNTSAILSSKNKKYVKLHLLKLCFFDNWICNEDRSHNNYNILYNVVNGTYNLFPIDHEACFNHQELKGELHPITLEDSLIYSELFHNLFNRKELTNVNTFASLKKECYFCASSCAKESNHILSQIPPEWGINIAFEQENLTKFLYSDEWFNKSWNNFIELIQLF